MALAAYRHLLRSTRIAFQGAPVLLSCKTRELTSVTGDFNTLTAARVQVRQNFEANRALSLGSEEISKQITHAEEVAKFLRENVVQGEAIGNEKDAYSKHGKTSSVFEPLANMHTRTTYTRVHRARR
jgi:complex III assembly factor LYRM7